jgi:hypothetical protein
MQMQPLSLKSLVMTDTVHICPFSIKQMAPFLYKPSFMTPSPQHLNQLAGQGRAGQGRAGQGRAGQDRIGQVFMFKDRNTTHLTIIKISD